MTQYQPCIVLRGPEDTRLVKDYLPVPDLSEFPANYVLLEVAYVGVCGSDVHFYSHGGVGSDVRKYAQYYVEQTSAPGLIMGHEASARVVQIGKNVKHLNPGKQVALEPGIPCRQCHRCAEGKYNLCGDMRFAASFHMGENGIEQTAGCLSKYLVLPEELCYELPDGIGLDEGVLVEPLAVAVHACRMAGIMSTEPGHGSGGVVVVGAGTIGICCAAVACALGAASVVLVDVVQSKLDFAKEWLSKGAAQSAGGVSVHTYLSKGDPKADAENLIKSCGLQDGADAVLEASGVPSAIALGVYALKIDGHMVQTGLSKNPLMSGFPITDLSEKEIHLHGAFRYRYGDFLVARDLLARGRVGSVKELISNVFEFEKWEDAWKATRDGKGLKNLIKVMDG